jgi:hypothetical protein
MALPPQFLDHLCEFGYHSRSDKHSKALMDEVVRALIAHCPQIASEAKAGTLVFEHNHDVMVGHGTWNTDLAIGLPATTDAVGATAPPSGMRRATPTTVRIAIEAKSVMTEHRKAVKNRKRDFEAHHAHVHDYDPQTIAGGIVLINAAKEFQSPLRPAITVHREPMELVKHCMGEFNSVTMTSGSSHAGLDANCVVVIDMPNVRTDHTPPYSAAYVTKTPAPSPGHPLYWDAFIQRICQLYCARFR